MTAQYAPQLELARAIATAAHALQTRADGSTPYIRHPEAVEKLLVRWVNVGTLSVSQTQLFRMRAAALLHDVIEDTPWTFQMLLERGVPADVVNLVDLLTKPDDGPAPLEYYLRMAMNREALAVKCADRCSNLMDAIESVRGNHSVHRWAKYAMKTRRDVVPLFDSFPALQAELTIRVAALEEAVGAAERRATGAQFPGG